jgi:pimeloyl-ACP methyl ester carboxylesterase
LLFADRAPERVAGLVLVAPALPPPLSGGEARMWQTLGRAGLAILAPMARVLLRLSGRRILAADVADARAAATRARRDAPGRVADAPCLG